MTCVLYLFLISILYTNGQREKSSLTFIMDVTKSMESVRSQVEKRANTLFDAVMQSNESYIDHFVLVTFADIDKVKTSKNNITKTKNRDEFKDSLALTLVTGGDCPEYSLSGIETGIENSLPGSTIYIFTDASAKDYEKYKHVSDKAQQKEIQMIFVLTGMCNIKKYGLKGYNVYTKLANDTSGQVFNLHKDSVDDILKYVQDSIVAKRIHLAAKSFPPGDAHSLNYITDNHTTNTTISVAGKNASIYVKGSDGKKVEMKNLVHLINVTISKVNDTKPDTYTVIVNCSTGCRVVVNARSDIKFRHGFSAFLPVSMNDTTVKPTKDDKTYLTINVKGNFLPQTVMLVDAFDNIIPGYTMPLKPLHFDDTQKLYVTAPFDSPLIMFRIVVTGLDLDDNTTISRMSTALVEPQDPKLDEPTDRKPTAEIEGNPKITAEFDTTLQLKCTVNAFPKPNITWESHGIILETKVFSFDLPYDYVSIHKIEKVNKNTTYICKAINTEGEVIQSVVVEAKPKKVFQIVEEPKDISIEYGKSGYFRCKINAYPPAKITWYKNGIKIAIEDGIPISVDGSEMKIKHMRLIDEGNYTCEVKNDMQKKEISFEIAISGVDAPVIDKKANLLNFEEGKNITLSCRIKKGTPKPTIQWYYENTVLRSVIEIIEARDEEDLSLVYIKRKDQGKYKCLAKNEIGNDTMETNVIVEYAPTLDNDTEPMNIKAGVEVTLTCPADGVPEPVIKWTKDDMQFFGSKFTFTSDHQLRFYADLNDTGVYKCNASNTLGSDSKTINVEVEKSPEVLIKGSNPIDAEYNEPLNITCEVLGYPKPKLIWTNISSKTKLETDLEEWRPYHFISHLEIEKVTENATYRCKASNTYGDDDKEVTVRTFRKPFFNVSKSPENKPYYVKYHDDIQFECKVDAYPPAEVNWYKNGKNLSKDDFSVSSDGFNLTIRQMQLTDEGKYMCTVNNSDVTFKYPFKIQLTGVEPPKIGIPSKTLHIPENSNTKISCRNEEGTPKPSIHWYYNNMISDIFVEIKEAKDLIDLSLDYIKRTDQGTYICVATNIVGNDSMETNLLVEYAPTIHNDFEPVTVLSDSKVNLSCVANGVSEPDVKWTKTGKPLIGTKLIPSGDYSLISIVDLDNKVIYKCSATNTLGPAIGTGTFKVGKLPTVVITDVSNQIVDYDGSLRLECYVSGYPAPDIKWTDTTNLVTLYGKTTSVAKFPHEYVSILNIHKVKKNAVYQCEAENVHGIDRTLFVVKTKRKPFFKVTKPLNTTITYNTIGQLYCKVFAYPPAKITWYKDSKLLTVKDSVKVFPDGGTAIEFKHIQPSQKGQYTCKASNSIKTENFMATVDISGLELPEIFKTTFEKRTSRREIWVKKGATVSLSCKIIKGIPKPSIKWLRKNKYTKRFEEIKTTEDLETYLVRKADKNKAGEYACQAINTLGSNSLKMDLKLETQRIKTKGDKKRTIYEHDTLQLYCLGKGKPKSKIKWIYEGTTEDPKNQLLSLDDADTHELIIKDIQYDQRGRYTCVANNTLGRPIKHTYEVDVYTFVRIHNKDGCTSNCVIRAVEGDKTLKIHCNATGHPKPHFTWTIDGIVDTKDRDTMVLHDVTKINIPSLITCEARNDENQFDIASYKVIVDDYPLPGIPKSSMKLDLGKSGPVICPIPLKAGDLLRWYKNNKKIYEGKLFINNAKISDAGLYTCRVSGSSDAESASVLLNVESKLTFKNEHVKTRISLGLGDKTDLDCKTLGYPKPKVSWFHNGRYISKKDHYGIKMKQARIGKYECKATNGIETITRIYDVTSNECLLKIDPDAKKQPLILSHMEWPTYKYDGGYLYMPKNQSILLVCQKTSKLKKMNSHYVYAYCNKTTQIEIEGNTYDYADIQCTKEIEPRVEWTTKSCFGEYSETIKIVHELDSTSIVVYEICMNSTHDVPIYTKHKMIMPFAGSVPKNATWFIDRFDFNFGKMYDIDSQLFVISSMMGSLFHMDDSCVFSKRQLVNPLDVFPGVPQSTTFTYLNVVPHWSTCSENNWDDVESRVRRLPQSKDDILIVWTGTAENLRLTDSYGNSVDMYISDQSDRRKPSLPVPKYMWKVVQNPKKRESLAIIQINIPDITLTEAMDYIKCTDICHLTIWMKGPRWHDMSRGYVFCCKLKDFEANFGYGGLGIFGHGMDNVLHK